MSKPRVIYWFRTDLRLHDSPALKAALDLQPAELFPIWCWDSHYVYRARVGVNRFQFLIDCQNDLSARITQLNPRSQLFVLREPALTLLPKLFRAWEITHLVFEKDTDAYARARDAQVRELAGAAGVTVIEKAGRTLWDPDEIVRANGGAPTMSITQLRAAGARVGAIAPPVPTPQRWPDPGDMKLAELEPTPPEPSPDVNRKHRDGEEASFASGLAGPNRDCAPPSLEELGMRPATTPHRGGETVVLRMLDALLADEEYTATFQKPKTSPAAFEPQSTCLTSPYLHFGALSCRYFYHEVERVLQKRQRAKQATSSPPESLQGQLLFRDMYFAAQAALGWRFGQTYDNAHCRFIPWHLPSRVDERSRRRTTATATAPSAAVAGGGDGGGGEEYEVDDAEKERWLRRWAAGTTGFPWIDAIMRQLRREGWIHHLARHAVACFLTRGGAYISWERGADVFAELLIDHEEACNVGNWQWLSCTAFYSQFHRCYSPVAFGQKWDPNGDFIRKFVPELQHLPAQYIYEPHKAPIADQKRAGVRIHGDGGSDSSSSSSGGLVTYPKPMFDFPTQRALCLAGMKTAYRVGMYGDDARVRDGTWKRAFADAEGSTASGRAGRGADGEGEDDEEEEEEEEEKKKSKNDSPSSTRARRAAGHKREPSQSTLEGAFGKAAKKR